MTEKQYSLVKCYNEMWGIYDRKQSAIDNPILIAYSKASVGFIVNQLNNKNERIQELEETIGTIAKDYEESHGMDIRNAEWFTAW